MKQNMTIWFEGAGHFERDEEIRCKSYWDHYSNIQEGNHSVTKLTHKVDGDHALVMSPQYQMWCSHSSLINPFFTAAHIPNHLTRPHTKLKEIVLSKDLYILNCHQDLSILSYLRKYNLVTMK